MKPKRSLLPVLFTLLLILIVIGLASSLSNRQGLVDVTQTPTVQQLTNRELWESHNISNYSMIVETLAFPVPPIGVRVSVKNGEIFSADLVACEPAQTQYRVGLCKTLEEYYPAQAHTFTIEDLLGEAEGCLQQNQSIFRQIGVMPVHSLASSEEVLSFMREHSQSIQSVTGPDWMCFVEFDPDYGYPTSITSMNPFVFDGVGTISVTEFHVDE